jgi:NADPH:quinone reductase-like Zn-dependent oxidoreductase
MSFHSDQPSLAARACWVVSPGHADIREETLAPLAEGEVRVRTRHTAVSRGTEGLVFRGEVPPAEWQRMRAPFQAGEFPGPVKYGYVNVGVVETGPAELLGRHVFCLYPHQTLYQVSAEAVLPLPDDVPPARAALAAQMETALNALWDAAPVRGSHLSVVGGGTIGLLVAWLAVREHGCTVQLVDTEPSRAGLAQALGATFSLPEDASGGADRVVHTSATSAGLATALRLAAFEATVLELSWYGSRAVSVPLGEAFHSQRLTLKSSQVGHVAPARRAEWSRHRRLALALSLLNAPVLDRLITDSAPFDQLPQVLQRLAGSAAPHTLCHRIDYPD